MVRSLADRTFQLSLAPLRAPRGPLPDGARHASAPVGAEGAGGAPLTLVAS